MATCRVCQQTYIHKLSCTKARGRKYVETRDELSGDYDYLCPPDVGDTSSSDSTGSSCGGGSE